MGVHNIQCWKNTAVGLAGYAANNEALVREAIDDPQRGFRVHSPRTNLMALIYGAAETPPGPFIPTSSLMMKNAGYAVLRAAGNAVAVRFGSHGGGHGHPDKLNIVTYAAGHLFGLDPGSINYGVPLHREWYRTTIAHNTVAVDGHNQSATDGELVLWGDSGTNSLVARADGAYPGVTLRRSLRLDGAILHDSFECASIQEHDYDYAFHAPGKLVTSPRLTRSEALTYPHIDQVSEACTDSDWWAEWEQEGARYRIQVRGVPGTVVDTGAGPGRNPASRVPLIIIRRHAKQTSFECTHVSALR